MPIQLPTLPKTLDPQVLKAVDTLRRHVNDLEGQINRLQAHASSLPTPLTMDQIIAGLTTGSAPLLVVATVDKTTQT